ncbi:MAG: GTPase Era [Lachnospiraceae bacterium]|nr:GTPase Era [Lachnospiraceae bacterium]
MANEIKSGFVTIVGRPNVGKSTLMNHLIGQKIAITSNKPQTTRNRIQTVYTDERGQIVFLDTPGMNEARNKLGEYMYNVASTSLNEVDVVLWLVEPINYIGRNEKAIVELLSKVKKPIILIMNKVDTVDKEKLAEALEVYKGALDFADIVSCSALRGVNLDNVLAAIYKALPYGPMYYDEDTLTDQPMRDIVAEIIREKALRRLNEEVPHGIAVTVESMKQRDSGLYDIDATIICEKDSHKGIIIGKNGSMLKRIGSDSRRDIEDMVENKVNLKIWVKVRREWRNNETQLRSFGYN